MLHSGAPSRRRSLVRLLNDDSNDETWVSQNAVTEINKKSLIQGDLVVHVAPILRFLTPSTSILNKPFQPPFQKGWRLPPNEVGLGGGKVGRTSLGMTRKSKDISVLNQFVPLKPSEELCLQSFSNKDDDENKGKLYEEYILNPVILYEGNDGHIVQIEPIVGKYLRDHQREGLQFLFECVANLRNYNGCGCILADDMGLGKTLQSVCLIYTVLRQGLQKDVPLAKRVIVVTPTSLVRNWDNEFDKWLKGRVRCLSIAESNRKEVQRQLRIFCQSRTYEVLVISYDTFRINANFFEKDDCCDLLICDEAHRLKNDNTQTSIALDKLSTRRRVLLSGTPLQNDLEEFFAMVNFCNPNILGTVSQFRKNYQSPILIGREPDASEEEIKKSIQRSSDLSDIVNNFILRRTNSLLSKHLPPKLTQIVCINMTSMQKKMYQHILYSKILSNEEEKSNINLKKPISAQSLASINALKKLCNHPQLLYQRTSKYSNLSKTSSKNFSAYGLEDINQFFPQNFDCQNKNSRRSYKSSNESKTLNSSIFSSNFEWSGKFYVCQRFLTALRYFTDDRIVIVSNYTQTLDIFTLMCKEFNFPCVRLDGSASAKRRQNMVDRLNDPTDDVFVFLLSSKAGGCGLNLIGANRLILFDPDWNPATDKQAAARVWRDGQKKRTYVYRFLATGSIEEKVFQRQLSKEGLQSVVADDQSLESQISMADLKDLFSFNENTISDTHDKYNCERCKLKNLNELPEIKDMVLSDSLDGHQYNVSDSIIEMTKEHMKDTCKNNKRFKGPRLGGITRGFQRSKFKFINHPASISPNSEQINLPNESDLLEWSHHFGCESCDDVLLRVAGQGLVSFVFAQAIDGNSMAKKAINDVLKKQSKETSKVSQKLNEVDENKSNLANSLENLKMTSIAS